MTFRRTAAKDTEKGPVRRWTSETIGTLEPTVTRTVQGRAVTGAENKAGPADPIIVHPDVRRMLLSIKALTEGDFVRILSEPDNALTRQYTALMGTEGVTVSFTDDGIAALARIAAEVNGTVENIGARRLYTVMERVFEDLSFAAPDKGGDEVRVDAAFVERELGELSRSADLSRYVL